MAGTGKSTILRTLAQDFANQGQLGASFFFKRGGGDCSNASKFFTTIASQLAHSRPALIPHIQKALETDSSLFNKNLEEQFKKLLLQPLSILSAASSRARVTVIVVDALDECENDAHIMLILRLLSQLQSVKSVKMHLLLASRPELPIRKEFNKMLNSLYQGSILHEIPAAIIEHDIRIYLESEFANIRDEHNASSATGNILPPQWPSDEEIQDLVLMAVPLFIFALTVCRFIADLRFSPKERLKTVLEYRAVSQADRMDATYLPVLDQLLLDLTDVEKETVAREFQEIVGSLVVLAEPLSALSLSYLLGVPCELVERRLNTLHSVLNISATRSEPVRLLHLSFREFVLDKGKRRENTLWVDERKAHRLLASKCLDALSTSPCLKEDTCGLQEPGPPRNKITIHEIDKCLPKHIQYACLYWVFHLENADVPSDDGDRVFGFLKTRLLYWLEVLSLLGSISESLSMITRLQHLFEKADNPDLNTFLNDTRRFCSVNSALIDVAPLQLYSSAIVFAPEASIVKRAFRRHLPKWICKTPHMPEKWSPLLHTLEGYAGSVLALEFLPDNRQLASAGMGAIDVWDAATGILQKSIQEKDYVHTLAFSSNGNQLATTCVDRLRGIPLWIRVWDTVTGVLKQELLPGDQNPPLMKFLENDEQMATCSTNGGVHIWDLTTGASKKTIHGVPNIEYVSAFSQNTGLVASTSMYEALTVWDVVTGCPLRTFMDKAPITMSIALSPNGTQTALYFLEPDLETIFHTSREILRLKTDLPKQNVSWREEIFTRQISSKLRCELATWDTETGTKKFNLKLDNLLETLMFSPHGNLLMLEQPPPFRIHVFDTNNGTCLQTLDNPSGRPYNFAFSPDGERFASSLIRGGIGVFDITVDARQPKPAIQEIQLSPNGKLLCLEFCAAHYIELWSISTNELLETFQSSLPYLCNMKFSQDSKQLAIASKSYEHTEPPVEIRIWDVEQGTLLHVFDSRGSSYSFQPAFSADGKRALSMNDDSLEVRDILSGVVISREKVQYPRRVKTTAVSSNGQTVAVYSRQEIQIRNIVDGRRLVLGVRGLTTIRSLFFSKSGERLLSQHQDGMVLVWHAATATLLHSFECSARGNARGLEDLVNPSSMWISSFAECERCFQTPNGLFKTQHEIHPTMDYSSCTREETKVFFERDWVTYGSRKILWIPPELRHARPHYQNGILALGGSSGEVVVIHFDVEELDRLFPNESHRLDLIVENTEERIYGTGKDTSSELDETNSEDETDLKTRLIPKRNIWRLN